MVEEIIEVPHCVELIRCPVCGNITTAKNDITLRENLIINNVNYEVRVFLGECNHISTLSLCNECYGSFKVHINELQTSLDGRKGMYDKIITINDKTVTVQTP